MEETEFGLKLVDAISGPANAAAAALGPLERAMGASQKAITQLDEATKKEAATLQKLKDQLASIQSGSEVNISQYKKLTGAIERSEAKLVSLGNAFDRATEKSIQLGEKGAAAQKKLDDAIAKSNATAAAAQRDIDDIQKKTAESMAARQARINASREKFAAQGVATEKAATQKWLANYQGAAQKQVQVTRKAESADVAAKARAEKAKQAEMMKSAKMKGKLGKLDDKHDDEVAASIASGVGIVTAALAAVTALVAAGASFAQSAVTFRDDTLLSFQAITKNAKQAEQAYSVVHDISQELPVSEAELNNMAAALLKAGTPIDQIGDKLRKQVKDSGKSFASITTVAAKFSDMMRGLFDFANPSVEKFNKSLGAALAFFKDTSSSGIALREIVGDIFGGLAKAAEGAIPFVKEGLRQIILTILRVQTALVPAQAALQKAFGPDASGKALAAFKGLLESVGGFYVFMAKTWSLVIQFFVQWYTVLQPVWSVAKSILGALVDIVNFTAGAFVSTTKDSLKAIADAFTWVKDAIKNVFSGGESIATDLINGIVSGLTGGASKVADALANVGKGAIAAVRNVFDSHSPSRLMDKLMHQDVLGGAVNGLNRGASEVSTAMTDAITPPTAVPAPSGSGGSGVGGASITVSPGAIMVSFGAPANQKEVAEGLEQVLTKMLENLAIQLGGNLGAA